MARFKTTLTEPRSVQNIPRVGARFWQGTWNAERPGALDPSVVVVEAMRCTHRHRTSSSAAECAARGGRRK